MKKVLIMVLVICMGMALILTGCNQDASQSDAAVDDGGADDTADTADDSSDEPAKDITIGFIPMTLNNEYFITMVNGAEQKAAEMGVKLEVQAGQSHASAEEQLQIIENMITSGVDAICIVPSSSEGLITALRKCEEANIPVINLDTRLNAELLESSGLKPVPFIGTDNYSGAKIAGEYAITQLEEGTKVAILTGIEGQENAAFRRNGFFDAASEYLDVVAEQTAKWEVDEGYIVTQNILQANPDLEFMFASNDGMAIGALRAIQEADKQDAIQVIGFDAVSEALNLVKEGKLLGTVAQFPAEMGIKGVEAAVDAINGVELELSTDTGTELITSENVEEFMEYLSQFS